MSEPRAALRAGDLFVATFEFVDLSLDQATGKLTPVQGKDGTIIIHLPPQQVGEQTFFESAGEGYEPSNGGNVDDPDQYDPIGTRLGAPSRLAFVVPATHRAIDCTIAGVLDACRSLKLRVTAPATLPVLAPVAQPLVAALWGRPAADEDQIAVARARARLQRWQDNSDLVPVVLSPPQDGAASSPRGEGTPARRPQRFVAGVIGGPSGPEIPTPAPPGPQNPGTTETSIELPLRLIVSPNDSAAWTHRSTPAGGAWVELWHTRLATQVLNGGQTTVTEQDHPLRTIRAVWSRDPGFSDNVDSRPADSSPFDTPMSLTAPERFDIVHLSSNHKLKSPPVPVDVDRLMLSALGGWIDCHGQWEPVEELSVREWRHRGTMGREHFVQVVLDGYLFPFGHKASLVTVTERKFHNDLPGHPAILRRRIHIVVRQPLLTYGNSSLSAGRLDRQFPFTSVRMRTLSTPDLDPPDDEIREHAGKELFWPWVGGKPFRFHLTAEDLEGSRIDFTAPLIFASGSCADDATAMTDAKAAYEVPDRSTVDFAGKRVALAPSFESGDTAFEVREMSFGAELLQSAPGPDRGKFYPRMRQASIVVPAIKQFTGAGDAAIFEFADEYLNDGLPQRTAHALAGDEVKNVGEVLLKAAGGAGPALDFSGGKIGDRCGALLQPNIPQISGISRLTGPVAGDLAVLADGTFKPLEFFSSLNAKMFGVIDLGTLLAEFATKAGLDLADVMPSFLTEAVAAVDAFLKELRRVKDQVDGLRQAADQAMADAEAAGETAVKERIEQAMAEGEALLSAVTSNVDNIAKLVDQLVEGVESASSLDELIGTVKTAVKDFRDQMNTLKGQLGELPPEIPPEPKKVLQGTVARFVTDMAVGAGNVDNALTYVDRLVHALQLPEELKMTFEWKPQLQNWPHPASATTSLFVAENKGKKATLALSATFEAKTKLHPDPRYDIACRLHNFALNLIGPLVSFMVLRFDKLEFTATSGSKPDVNVEFDEIEFAGPLSFVEALRDLIPLDGFSDPPALAVSEDGIAASYSLSIPEVAFGVFSLQNLSLGAGFNLPFLLGPLTVRFNFCEREAPFLLTVSMFGGGGFFGVTLDPDGIEILEASFEFGASVSMNFGVASGGITVMGGIYFHMQGDEATLTGYLRMAGVVQALGLVSISIELYMGLTYESGKCVGRATISVEIEIALFTIPLEISVERKLAGSNGDPTFAELMGPGADLDPDEDPWAEYCMAFA